MRCAINERHRRRLIPVHALDFGGERKIDNLRSIRSGQYLFAGLTVVELEPVHWSCKTPGVRDHAQWRESQNGFGILSWRVRDVHDGQSRSMTNSCDGAARSCRPAYLFHREVLQAMQFEFPTLGSYYRRACTTPVPMFSALTGQWYVKSPFR